MRTQYEKCLFYLIAREIAGGGAIVVDMKNASLLLRKYACSRSKHKQNPPFEQDGATVGYSNDLLAIACLSLISVLFLSLILCHHQVPTIMVNARQQESQPLCPEYLTKTLPSLLPPIFDQAQQTTANHRKNIVYLRKIHEQCATIVEEISNDRIKLTGEKAFNSLFFDMVNRVLTVKKGVAVADRVVKFVANYVSYCTETGMPFLHSLLLYNEFNRFFQMLLISLKTKMRKKKSIRRSHASLSNFSNIFWEALKPKTRMSDFVSLL